ncbi:hypothetical protein KLP40_08185 [Hymenobacter sp. NST-14]|uniref:beta-ketoacyl synthase N-terminal-like domain-containing protein n=1 Tax=Hymenobacter piscis TaxID=2839984 RepID=UPI001C021269|nr:beta-ketoacyl synthase N-terminal-like domain-containing protein [Hymenobacter piscis]MBT9393140.1 hypothetical protein [Hymenobacter piscis]
METSITATCAIRGRQIFLNGTLLFEAPEDTAADLSDFLIAGYRHFGVSYPKFFKMDVLSKLAFLTAELLLPKAGLQDRLRPADIGVVLTNRSSSLLTDVVHQQSIAEPASHFPSPAVFVYTLPNIAIGEISIRHQLTGENSLFVTESFEPAMLVPYVSQLLAEKSCQACLCGWLEAGLTGHEAFFYLVENHASPAPTPRPHRVPDVELLYSQPHYS